MKNWFDVDKDGLAKLLEARGKGFILLELLQNAWDQNVTRVDVTVEPLPGVAAVRIVVTDNDPFGFADLSHAFTVFAESAKVTDPEKRGRFNLGEKLVLACCTRASISTTTGTVVFDDDGRHRSPKRREAGSQFVGEMRMTRDETAEMLRVARTVLPPVETWLNGERLPERATVAVWKARLQTEVAEAGGLLRRVERETLVVAVEPLPGEVGTLYEMGIPVVETGDRWHVSVGQKVPLTLDRTNVPPAYLRAVRVGVLNALASQVIGQTEATQPWVRDAAGHPDAAPEAVRHVLTERFGERRVAYDPSDREANGQATMEGYTVVSGGALSAAEWENARRADALPAAGRVTPSPKPFTPGGAPLRLLEAPTAACEAFSAWAGTLGRRLLGVDVRIRLADDPAWGFGGCFGGGELTVNVARFGGRNLFFADGPTERIVAFLIHEFAHHRAHDHLSREYYEACCAIGARLALLIAEEPTLLPIGTEVE